MKRRDFIKYFSGGLAGLTVGSTTRFPLFGVDRAFGSTTAWKFGVMADTQWQTGSKAGGEPMSCAASIIDALNEQFILHGCKLVIQVGDLVNNESVSSVRALPTRAEHAVDLYNAGIAFYPIRGNHESSSTAASEMRTLFPQNLGLGDYVFGGSNFNSPMDSLKGLSYILDYNDDRFVLIDQFVRLDGTNADGTSSYNNNLLDQIDWVEENLSSRSSDMHAFVLSHKNLIGQNHKDVVTGSSLTANATERDRFLSIMNENGVGYYLGGHDHMHHRSLVTTSDKSASVNQIICSSNSYKFYIPGSGDDNRESPLEQELFTIGYYIFTVDGPRVTVDFYSSSHGQDYGDADLVNPPNSYTFYLRETFGYSLNGQRFEIAQGDSYTNVQDSYGSTTAKVLSGTNGNAETDYLGRSLSKSVSTGWSDPLTSDAACSNVLTLWGMADNLSLWNASLTGLLPSSDESEETDVYTLSLSYDPKLIRPSQAATGKFCLASKDSDGSWVNAVDVNYSGSKKFKYGPWKSGYAVGTYGVDPTTSTVWAVLDHDGDFVAKIV